MKNLDCNLMMHENQQARMLWAMVMIINPEKKERTVKGDQCNSAKDPSTVKSVFSLEHNNEKL